MALYTKEEQEKIKAELAKNYEKGVNINAHLEKEGAHNCKYLGSHNPNLPSLDAEDYDPYGCSKGKCYSSKKCLGKCEYYKPKNTAFILLILWLMLFSLCIYGGIINYKY